MRRIAGLFVLSMALALFAGRAGAESARYFNGYWAGVWKNGTATAVSVAFYVRAGKVKDYILDGRTMEVDGTRYSDGWLRVTGPQIDFAVQRTGRKQLKAVSADGEWTAVLKRTAKEPWRRPPVFISEYYGGTHSPRADNPEVSSRYLDSRCCFGGLVRPGPHAGIDFNARRHTSVIATADGVVSRLYSAANDYGCGNGLTIKHRQDLYSSYCHLEAVANLRVGQKLKRGDLVGTVGSTGMPSRGLPPGWSPRDMPHVHYELTRDGKPHADGKTSSTLDPKPLLVGCFGSPLPGRQKVELTYPVLCKDRGYKAKM